MIENKTKFISYLASKLQRPVLWGSKGYAKVDNVVVSDVFDCSGLVTCAIRAATGVDLTIDHNAQKLSDETPYTNTPQAGDLCFYGKDWGHVIHVAVYMEGGKCLTASGATSSITNLIDALKARHHISLEPVVRYRTDFLGIHTNTYIKDSIQ